MPFIPSSPGLSLRELDSLEIPQPVWPPDAVRLYGGLLHVVYSFVPVHCSPLRGSEDLMLNSCQIDVLQS
jgi:hypothetical protein